MAVSPNSDCEDFCIWMQATSWLKITASQDVFIEEVKDAAASSGTVTEHVWNEFLRTTGLWWQYYTAYLAQINPSQNTLTDISATSTITGWSSFTVKQIWISVNGKNLHVYYNLQGTSNSTLVQFTIPYTAINAGDGWNTIARASNNGGASVPSICVISNNASLVRIFKDMSAGAFTNSGTKYVIGYACIPIQ